MQLRLSHKALIFSGVLLFELVLVAIFGGRLGKAESDLQHSYVDSAILSHLNNIQRRFTECQLAGATGSQSLKRQMEWISYEFSILRDFLRDNPEAVESLDHAEHTINAQLRDLTKEGGGATPASFAGLKFRDAFSTVAGDMEKIASGYQHSLIPDPKTQSRHMVDNYIFIFIVLDAMVAVASTLYFMQGIAYRLGILTDNSIRFARGQDLHPLLEGTDEIAQLDRTIHETIAERKLVEDLLKKSEARTRSLIENMPIGVVTIDEEGLIESINPRIEEIFGYGFDEIDGDHFMALFCTPPELDKKEYSDAIYQKALEGSAELESRRKNGEIFPVEMTLTECDTVDGKRYLANIQDITERKRAEQLKQELVAMVSHDLRSPLTSVQGVITLLCRGMYGKLTETGEQRVKVAEASIARLINLVDDILDLERMEAGKLQFNPKPLPASSIVDKSIESVYDFAQQNQITIDSGTSDVEIYVDEDRLVQVMVNLLANSVKFSPPASTIQVGFNVLPREVEIWVQDRGPGIAPEAAESVFQRFYQLDGTRNTGHKGAGLGLAICKAIVEAHGGTIGVVSDGGTGSKFWFRVPRPQKLTGGAISSESLLTS